ncbi:MAG: epoxyqueuosine reductase [Candidatus Tectomicrobia bacterium]|nr:epoxyqueuosine reductase [Candidatus Tectomicrobia bacterium]
MELTAETVKAKALELGADVVGIASGAVLDQFPPDPSLPQTPSSISDHDNKSVIVLARKFAWGLTRVPKADQNKLYTAQLELQGLEELAYDLVIFLEDHGYPAITVPAVHTMWEMRQGLYGPLSLRHAAVEAGLGTLGLNLQLLTPRYGPRVMLMGVLTCAPLEPDQPMHEALCKGPECGRCLLTCPGDAALHWNIDKEKCSPHAWPYGWQYLTNHIKDLMTAGSFDEKWALVKGKATFELWQSMLQGVGVNSGCTRCLEVCPVGEDYELFLKEAQEEIPEATPEKQARLQAMRDAEEAGDLGPSFAASRRWIGAYPALRVIP